MTYKTVAAYLLEVSDVAGGWVCSFVRLGLFWGERDLSRRAIPKCILWGTRNCNRTIA